MSDPIHRQVRLGILGAAAIAPKALVVPARGLCSVRAIASRDAARAEAFARAHAIPIAYGSYRELLEDPELDAVYVATPASHHARWVEESLRSGKHVLCEKPFGVGVEPARRLTDLARSLGKVLMEAHHSHYHPLRAQFLAQVAKLGLLRGVTAVFDASIANESDIRLTPELGAGVFLDFGGYLLSWLGWVAEASGASGLGALRVVAAEAKTRPANIDRTMTASLTLELPSGPVPGAVACSMEPGVSFQARIIVQGAGGEVRFENPLALEGSFLQGPGPFDHYEAPSHRTTYRAQLETFCQAVLEGNSVRHSGQEIVLLQELTDRVYEVAGLPPRLGLLAAVRSSSS